MKIDPETTDGLVQLREFEDAVIKGYHGAITDILDFNPDINLGECVFPNL